MRIHRKFGIQKTRLCHCLRKHRYITRWRRICGYFLKCAYVSKSFLPNASSEIWKPVTSRITPVQFQFELHRGKSLYNLKPTSRLIRPVQFRNLHHGKFPYNFETYITANSRAIPKNLLLQICTRTPPWHAKNCLLVQICSNVLFHLSQVITAFVEFTAIS